MEGLKCPICKAISLVNVVNDGEMYTCPFCNYKYTITSVRRYFLHPYKVGKEPINFENFHGYIKELGFQQLVEMIKLTTKEMEKRLSNKEKRIEKSN